jgi:hypothetical protein
MSQLFAFYILEIGNSWKRSKQNSDEKKDDFFTAVTTGLPDGVFSNQKSKFQ